jgi:hypothetical protein
MSTIAQWVAYRAEPGKLLRAPLPSTPQVGEGWRGVELRRVHPLDQLDDLVVATAGKVGACVTAAPVTELLGDERDPSELQDVARRQLARRAGRAGTRRRWLALGRRG